MKTNTKVVMAAIAAITTLELFALSQGIDGILLTAVIATIAGLAGWVSPQLKVN